ncbi:hypothetical protein GPALN_005031 [Globodera pallida]|nr:hypothetical protein GPALN_005031 [Globodera pallida]
MKGRWRPANSEHAETEQVVGRDGGRRKKSDDATGGRARGDQGWAKLGALPEAEARNEAQFFSKHEARSSKPKIPEGCVLPETSGIYPKHEARSSKLKIPEVSRSSKPKFRPSLAGTRGRPPAGSRADFFRSPESRPTYWPP